MKLLISTHCTQGQRPDDFCFVPEGELLRFALQHTVCRDSCGCGRAMFGMQSRKGTTTMLVADLPMGDVDLARVALTAYIEAGGGPLEDEPDEEMGESLAQDLILAAMPFEVGDIVGRDGLRFAVRGTLK